MRSALLTGEAQRAFITLSPLLCDAAEIVDAILIGQRGADQIRLTRVICDPSTFFLNEDLVFYKPLVKRKTL
uniref:Oxidoreductase n=1 Tax=Angiostrongylus cantonensis TaxID=6313 RepID=A0A0K0DL05_ANGCA